MCVCERHRGKPSSKSCSQTCSRPRRKLAGASRVFCPKKLWGTSKVFFHHPLKVHPLKDPLPSQNSSDIPIFHRMIKLPPVEMEPVCQILRVQVQKSRSFTEEFLSFILMEKTFGPTKSFLLGGTKLLGAPKVFSDIFTKTFQASSTIPKNLATTQHASSALRHPLAAKISLCCCCCCFCWCSEISITGYVVNFKINLGDVADVALVWPEI